MTICSGDIEDAHERGDAAFFRAMEANLRSFWRSYEGIVARDPPLREIVRGVMGDGGERPRRDLGRVEGADLRGRDRAVPVRRVYGGGGAAAAALTVLHRGDGA